MIYNNPGIVEYGGFDTEILPLFKVTLRDLQIIQVLLNMVILIPKHFRYSRKHFVIYNNPGIVEYGEFNTETLPLLKVTLRDLQ